MTLLTFPKIVVPAAPQKRPLEIGFLSPHNPFDRRSFSGTAYFAARALAQEPGIHLRCLGRHSPANWLSKRLGRASPQTRYQECDFAGLDAVVGLVASDLLDKLAAQHPDLPFIHVTDATPAFLRTTYGWALPKEADATEARVAQAASTVVYSSQVMAQRAPKDLSQHYMDIEVQPFGVNFETLPELPNAKQPLKRLELLFIGLDWVRKGGDVAVETLNKLHALGQDARLTIIGSCPKEHQPHPHIRHLGFLNKNRPRDAAKLTDALAKAHVLLLPSRGDCTPMVVAEAMIHGTPVVASDTGGVAEMIATTGRVLAPCASPTQWAETLLGMTADPMLYAFLSDAAFDRAQTHLCWSAWSKRIAEICQGVTQAKPHVTVDQNVAVNT